MQMANIPFIFVGDNANSISNAGMPMFGILKFEREFELEADYFGIQYLYKTGYDPDCFLNALQNVWQTDPTKPTINALSPFPPVADRIKALQKEIHEILPSRAGAVVSTSEFDGYMGRLRQVPLLHSRKIRSLN